MGGGIGIKSLGVFVPRARMPRAAIADAHAWALPGLKSLGRGERAFCSWDEDPNTLAVQAARHCLAGQSEIPHTLTVASTTAPFADLQNAALVGQALRLPETVTTQDAAGSTRAGLRALVQALETPNDSSALVVAADSRRAKPGSAQELTYGAGAAAFLTGHEAPVARYLGSFAASAPFVDHFRQSGAPYDYYWEERWIRDAGVAKLAPGAVKQLLTRIDVPAARVAWFGLAGAPAGSDALVAAALGIPRERLVPDLQGTVGDTGAAHALLLLAGALERASPGDVVVIAAFSFGCEAVAFEVTRPPTGSPHGLEAALGRKTVESSYLKMLSFMGEFSLDWGPRSETVIKASLSQQYRSAASLAFVGGRCGSCGQVQFPVMPNCVRCAVSGALDPYPLADEPAQLATVSADWLQYYPAPPLYVGLVQFEVGARALMEIVDVPAPGIEVGAPLNFAFRLKAHDELRHYSRYFWKAVPAA